MIGLIRPRLILATMLAVLTIGSAARACPNCKGAVAAQPSDSGDAGSGYSRSIVLMMAMPFVLLGGGGVAVVRASRRGALPKL